MSENYFYSSLSGQEIEDTLVGAVRFNAMQGLTTAQKAQARQNIGAGEDNTQIKIKGFYDTLEDLQQHLTVGTEGDVYAVGTASPYDLYIWDAVNIRWVNNGPISFSDAIIDDNDVSTSSTWSSTKMTNELAAQKAEIDSDIDAVTQSVEMVAVSLSTYVRPNLLDNWYFGKGFPVNQRGQYIYASAGYSVDRWKIVGSTTSVTVSASFLRISKSTEAGGEMLVQFVDNQDSLVGKTVTISALFYDGSFLQSTVNVPAEIPSGTQTIESIGALNGVGLFLRSISGKLAISFYATSAYAANTNLDIIAVKMELGSTQTLAHQENNAWVLNEIPNYRQELIRCQAYLQRLASSQRIAYSYITSGWIDFNVPLSAPLAGDITLLGTFTVANASGTTQSGFTIAAFNNASGFAQIRATKASHGLTDAKLINTTVAYLSCEP